VIAREESLRNLRDKAGNDNSPLGPKIHIKVKPKLTEELKVVTVKNFQLNFE